ncbi:MAG: hypothetical protein R6X06_08960 [Gammaproteobacteria bacterium]
MKKIILGVVVILAIAIAAVSYYLLTNLDELVRKAIEKYGSQTTQTAVRVGKVRLQLGDSGQSGSGAIHDLTVANPPGFSAPYALSLGEISTRIDLSSLAKPPYIIDTVTVRAPQIFFEVNGARETNLVELKNNLSGAGSATRSPKSDDDSAGQDLPRLIVRRVVFSDGQMQARVVPLDNKEYQLKLPSLTMSNLGGEQGATPPQLAREIIERLIEQARQQIKQQGIDAELDKLKAQATSKIEAEKAKLRQESDQKLDQQKQKLDEKLKGFLGQ